VRFDQLPAGHAALTDEFVQYCPMAQGMDANEPMGQYCPDEQGVGGSTGSAQVLPAGHGAHTAPEAYSPSAQDMHCCVSMSVPPPHVV